MPKQPKHIFHPECLLATIACLAVAGLGVNLISAAFKGEDAKQSPEPTTAVTTQSKPVASLSIKPQPLAKANVTPEKQSTNYRDIAYAFLQQEGIEGFRSTPYKDINGNETTGVGFLIGKGSPIPWDKYPLHFLKFFRWC